MGAPKTKIAVWAASDTQLSLLRMLLETWKFTVIAGHSVDDLVNIRSMQELRCIVVEFTPDRPWNKIFKYLPDEHIVICAAPQGTQPDLERKREHIVTLGPQHNFRLLECIRNHCQGRRGPKPAQPERKQPNRETQEPIRITA